jgi:hypothetical protein
MAQPRKGVAIMQEENNGVQYEAGLYRHPDTGAELVTKFDPLFGDAQSEGVARVGFVRVGDAPTDYEVTLPQINASAKSENTTNESETVKGLQARMTLIENEKAATAAQLEAAQAADVVEQPVAPKVTKKAKKGNKK